MRGKKGTVLAVVISAALITAGLILSCGDDDGNGNGEPAATWEDVCEKLIVDCGLLFKGSVEDCEDWGEVVEEESGVDLSDLLDCTVDARCEHTGLDCWCKAFCERLVECEIDDEDELIFCLADCAEDFVGCFTCEVGDTVCVLENSCGDIIGACLE